MTVRPDFFHAAGAVHGSVYFKLLDDAAYFDALSHTAFRSGRFHDRPDEGMAYLDAECGEHGPAAGQGAVRLGHEPLEQMGKSFTGFEERAAIKRRIFPGAPS